VEHEHALIPRGTTTARFPAEPIRQHLGFAFSPVAESCAVGHAKGRRDGIDVNRWCMAARDAAFLGANRFQIEVNPRNSEVHQPVGAVRILTAVTRGRIIAVGNVVTGTSKRSEDRKVSSVAITGAAHPRSPAPSSRAALNFHAINFV